MPVTADRNGSGDAVGFNFNPDANKVQPGESSNVLVIQTNAISFASGWSSVIDGGATNVPTFQPTRVRISENAPEPASFILFGSGLVAVAFVTRRRVFRNKQ
jgi:PEP-CTERM motif-containing protein